MNNKTKLKQHGSTLLIGINFEHQFENGGPKIVGSAQVIVCEGKEQNWVIDCVDTLSIDEIHMMGVAITGNAEQKAAFDYFKSMGISLYREASKVLEEIVDCSGTVEQFVFEQTGITLPTLK